MEREYLQFLMDIFLSIKKIKKYTSEFGIASLKDEGIYYDAVLRNLEIIGEASKFIPKNIKVKYPEIAWKEIYGLRNIISHEYFGIDISEIEFIIINDLPILDIQIEEILNNLNN
jgi:uncharacterized protein with HEPN domain